MAKSPIQLGLPLTARTWGGARTGAGRKPGNKRSVPHRTRPMHKARHPVHATMRARGGLPPFREQALFLAIRRAIAAASRSPRLGSTFRVVQFSVQNNHVHLIVEAHDKAALSRGMLGLGVRLARAINKTLDTYGQVWCERYHGHALRTPREVRNAIVYVLMNAKKHGSAIRGIDVFSSAPWFDGFRGDVPATADARPVASARTWLAGVGWRKRGLIRPDEQPARSIS